jgi:2-oxoglutarate ferredoxin oxidoreductase subunit alpha
MRNRPQNLVRSLFLNPDELERNNLQIKAKYDAWEQDEIRYETYRADDPALDVLVAAYGTMARIAKTAIDNLRDQGLKVGLIRPISLYPFPRVAVGEVARKARRVLVVELSTGQMVDDVRWAVAERVPVRFFGKTGGNIPTPEDIAAHIQKAADEN